MLTSLRARLIVAFGSVIALSLLLASGTFAYMLRDYQAEREKDRLQTVAMGVSGQVLQSLRRGVPLPEVESQIDQLSRQADVRILLISDRGIVLKDTEDDRFVGRVLPIPPPGGRLGIFQGTIVGPAGDQIYAVVPFRTPNPREEPLAYRVAVIAPEQSLQNAWRELVPRLSVAALGALAVSVAIAWWLASTITRPVAQITHASEQMACGNYDQEIPISNSSDEIGRLARTFNVMSREVARSHRAMRDLLANVSHDLRTPLTSIQGFAGALVDGTLDGGEGAREAGHVIVEEAERMRKLVEDLLYLGRIESGEVALDRTPLDLADLTRAAHVRFGLRAEQAGVTLLRVDPPGSVPIRGDAHRLAQVLDNLIDNALKHTPRGGVITVSTTLVPATSGSRTRSAEAGRALVSVHNTGSLIPPDELDRVFERFYQLDKSRTGNGGRGLGLAIAREIVQAHGGSIRAESAPGVGTTFSMELQLLESPRAANIQSSAQGVRREALTAGQ